MDCKVLQHTTTDWWVVGVCVCVCVGRGEETADLKLLGFFFFFFPLNKPSSSLQGQCPSSGGTGVGREQGGAGMRVGGG